MIKYEIWSITSLWISKCVNDCIKFDISRINRLENSTYNNTKSIALFDIGRINSSDNSSFIDTKLKAQFWYS